MLAVAAAIAGAALVAGIDWRTPPAKEAAPASVGAARAATNPWLAVAHGEDVPLRSGDAAAIDPFANGATAAAAKAPDGPAQLRLSAPTSVPIGDLDDVVVSLDAPARVRHLSFKVAMGADVLQAQSGTQGDWTADPHARFTLDIAPTDDTVAIDAMAGREDANRLGGSIARIRVQAMAAGATQVRLVDIRAEDDQGRPVVVVATDGSAGVNAVAPAPVATADATRGRDARPVGDMSETD